MPRAALWVTPTRLASRAPGFLGRDDPDGGRYASGMQFVRRGSVYFALVFAVGFVLGVIRVIALVPSLGERWAEIIEAPLMLLASWVCARFVVRRYPSTDRLAHLASGVFALGLLLVVEFTVVLALRGLTLEQYLATRDPVAGGVYVVSLVAFASMPWWVSRDPA